MIAKGGAALYRVNLIRELREREKKSEQKRRLAVILSFGCFGFFILSLVYSTLTIIQMEKVLGIEKDKVSYLKQEYQKYKANRLIIGKEDIELLNSLQGKGIFWTKKLAAMASHLPDNYSITAFSFSDNVLKVSGYGIPAPNQSQLLVLDRYLNELRADTNFSNVFTKVYLNSAERQSEDGRVAFGFSAKKAGAK